MGEKAQIVEMLDMIPGGDLPVPLEIVRRFVPVSVEDIASPEDIEAYDEAMREYRNGETVPHDAIDWNTYKSHQTDLNL